MKPRWLRHMIATPSPSPTPPSASPRAIALERECTSEKLSVPASSSIIGSSGWFTAAPAIPAAGEAPHRESSTAIAASLSGRTGRITPASASTLTLNGTSLSDPSGPSLIRRATWSSGPVTMSGMWVRGRQPPKLAGVVGDLSLDASERSTSLTLFARFAAPQPQAGLLQVDHRDRDAGDALFPTDPPKPLVGRGLDAHPRRQHLRQEPLHLGAMRPDARGLADERGVDVQHTAVQGAERHSQEVQRVGVPPLLLIGREERSQVAEATRAEDRIDDRVR